MKKANALCERLSEFALGILRTVDSLPRTRVGIHFARQLMRSGTSPGANYQEACEAESRSDFIHKLSICQKELRETRYWLGLLRRSQILPSAKVAHLQQECHELCRIFGQSLITAKSKRVRTTPRTR